jgi:hypothetical protein
MPYWDGRCGVKFTGPGDLPEALDGFWRGVAANAYAPREMVLERFTLTARARDYLDIAARFS